MRRDLVSWYNQYNHIKGNRETLTSSGGCIHVIAICLRLRDYRNTEI